MINEHHSLAEAPSLPAWRIAVDSALRTGLQGSLRFLGRHWLAVANGVNAIIILVATVGVVLLHEIHQQAIIDRLFSIYHLICLQEWNHSYYYDGQQFALCERNLAIFVSLFVGGLGYSLIRNRILPISLVTYGVLCLPMAVDGFSQMWGWRDSDVVLRTLTGSLFGLASLLYLYPAIDLRRRWNVLRAQLQAGDTPAIAVAEVRQEPSPRSIRRR